MAIGLSKWFKKTFLGYEEKTVRSRGEDGKYVGDDKSTPDVNEAYTTVKVKVKKNKFDITDFKARQQFSYWWGFWVIANITGALVNTFYRYDLPDVAIIFEPLSALLYIGSALYFIGIIKLIYLNQIITQDDLSLVTRKKSSS